MPIGGADWAVGPLEIRGDLAREAFPYWSVGVGYEVLLCADRVSVRLISLNLLYAKGFNVRAPDAFDRLR